MGRKWTRLCLGFGDPPQSLLLPGVGLDPPRSLPGQPGQVPGPCFSAGPLGGGERAYGGSHSREKPWIWEQRSPQGNHTWGEAGERAARAQVRGGRPAPGGRAPLLRSCVAVGGEQGCLDVQGHHPLVLGVGLRAESPTW